MKTVVEDRERECLPEETDHSKESCPVRPIPAYKAGLYGLTEDRQLSESNSKPPFIPVHRTGFSGCFNKILLSYSRLFYKRPRRKKRCLSEVNMSP
jgi:hypothetical protein